MTSPISLGSLALDTWVYSDFFAPLPDKSLHPVVDDIESYVKQCELDEHPFFSLAVHSKPALKLWVSQEIVMTNAFSQIVLFAASSFKNVHARAVLCDVAYGEHGRVKAGRAPASHPWLLHRLGESIGLVPNEISPALATRGFIERLCANLRDPLAAVAYIGVGNERLIVPEYEAIKRCFSELWPNADFEPFLQANLTEDITHSRLCYELASMLIASDDDAVRFLSAAKSSVDSRVKYFDELFEAAKL